MMHADTVLIMATCETDLVRRRMPASPAQYVASSATALLSPAFYGSSMVGMPVRAPYQTK